MAWTKSKSAQQHLV